MNQRNDYIKRVQQKLGKDTGNVFLKRQLAMAMDTSRTLTAIDMKLSETEKDEGIFTNTRFDTFEQYDSAEKKLPPAQRDGWLVRRFVKIDIDLKQKFNEDPDGAIKELIAGLLHRLPYLLFVSLPLFALILKLVYIRRRKEFYYADHGVFTIYLYVFTFLLLIPLFCLSKLDHVLPEKLLNVAGIALILLLFFYLYKAMRNFYGQRRMKTFIKFCMVALLSLIMMMILLALFFIFSAATL